MLLLLSWRTLNCLHLSEVAHLWSWLDSSPSDQGLSGFSCGTPEHPNCAFIHDCQLEKLRDLQARTWSKKRSQKWKPGHAWAPSGTLWQSVTMPSVTAPPCCCDQGRRLAAWLCCCQHALANTGHGSSWGTRTERYPNHAEKQVVVLRSVKCWGLPCPTSLLLHLYCLEPERMLKVVGNAEARFPPFQEAIFFVSQLKL